MCIISPGGAITIVECKLASNSERRKMVIGQVLDYASAIWVDGPKLFREQWNRQRGDDLNGLGETALEQLDINITEGRIDLCLAVDRIDNDLKRLVEFLNRITRDESDSAGDRGRNPRCQDFVRHSEKTDVPRVPWSRHI